MLKWLWFKVVGKDDYRDHLMEAVDDLMEAPYGDSEWHTAYHRLVRLHEWYEEQQ